MKNSEKIKHKFESMDKLDILDTHELLSQLQNYLPAVFEILSNRSQYKFKKTKVDDLIEIFDEEVPNNPTPLNEIEEFVVDEIFSRLNFENENFFGFIPRDPAPPAIIGQVLSSFFNQFLGSAFASVGATAIEALTIRWITKIIGYEDDSYGVYTIGGSNANLTGIYTGLVNSLPWDYHKYGLIGQKRPVIYTSDQAHMCINKAVRYLGLGDSSLRIIESNDKFQIDVDKLQKQIINDRNDPRLIPIMIVVNAGTTNTGTIDDLQALTRIAQDHNLWMHTDAAYGGFAKLANHPVSEKLSAIHMSDSIAIDTHKWLYTPLEGGIALVKNGDLLKKAYKLHAEYLVDTELEKDHYLLRNFSDYGFPLSRKWRGLKVWFNLKYYGTDGLGKLITQNITVTDYLRAKIEEHEDMYLTASGDLSVVCFRWNASDEFNNKIIDTILHRGNFFLGRTYLKGKVTMRVAIVNLKTKPSKIDELIHEIEAVVNNIS